MFQLIDNFLPPPIFQMLHAESHHHFKNLVSSGKRVSNNIPTDVASAEQLRATKGLAWYVLFTKIADLFPGKLMIPTRTRLHATIKDYADWHFDLPLPEKHPHANLEQGYSALFYTHSAWEPVDPGAGNFETRFGSYEPLPNRMIVFSRDVEHRVAPGNWGLIRWAGMINFHEDRPELH